MTAIAVCTRIDLRYEGRSLRTSQLRWEMPIFYDLIWHHSGEVLHVILQFPDIARPSVCHQAGHHFVGDFKGSTAKSLSGLPKKQARKQW